MALTLETKIRTTFGKATNTLRKTGFIPAELYGHGIPNQHLSIPAKAFLKLFKQAGEHTVFDLVTEDKKKIPVLVADAIKNHMTGEFLAVDFHAVKMDELIQTKVPIILEGESPAHKAGFIVVQVLDEAEVETLPAHIPHKFVIDTSSLQHAGQSVHIKDIVIPKEVKMLTPLDTVIVTISDKPRKEEPVPAAEPVAETSPEGEVKENKKDE